MALRINQNVLSLGVQRYLHRTNNDMTTAVERLSSGLRINHAWDDPAGLAVSEKFRAQISSMASAQQNTSQNINLVATAEGALGLVDDKLIRMRQLSVEAGNGSLTTLDRSYLDVEFQQLKSEITRVASVTNYNGNYLIDGSFASNGILMQVGPNAVSGEDYYSVTIADMTSSGLGLSAAALTTTAAAQSSIGLIDSAINTKDSERTRLGSYVERLNYTLENLQIQHENAVASEATIRDTDVAAEMSNFIRAQILMQSGTAMLAQANQLPQITLGLL
jgi:flagellin